MKMKRNNHKNIYEFDPVIYPVRLWVVASPPTAAVENLFYPMDDNGNVLDGFGDSLLGDGQYARTFIVGNKHSLIKGCLVALFRSKGCGAGVCAHEALHFIAYMSEQFDIELGGFNESEPLAYLEQWATNCIWSVLVGRPKQMNGKPLKED